MRKKKGQTIVFEQVLIFSISVAIFIAAFTLFSMYQTQYMSITTRDHLAGVKEYVMSNIIDIAKKEGFNSSLTVKIPRTISNRLYILDLNNNGLYVNMTGGGIYEFSGLGVLNDTFTFGGQVSSDLGVIVIYKKGDKILLM
ncbi:MAG: hypothetical protein JW754_01075 [Candidatus Aenigmarchaeota archaeon]|nr:hypothetical protein [Candidatus Aenigmarchaeota archaeon]